MSVLARTTWSDPEKRWSLLSHALMAVTVAVPTILVAVTGPAGRTTTLLLAAAYTAWYVAFVGLRPENRDRPGIMVVYTAGAVVLFTALVVREGSYIILVYGLMPLLFASLPRGVAVLAVAALLVAPPVVSGQVESLVRDRNALLNLLATVGLGLVVTAVIEALDAQSEEQQRTIAELEHARAEIAGLLEAARQDLRDRAAIVRTGHALMAARTSAAVVDALATELADHSAAVRGVALVSPDEDGLSGQVEVAAPGTACPPVGSTVPLPPRPFDDGVSVVDALCPDGTRRDPPAAGGAHRVAVLDLATAGHEQEVRPLAPGAGRTRRPAPVLWLALGAQPDAEVLADLSSTGAQAALALAKLRLAAEAAARGRAAGTLDERRRLAHELHDTIAQAFTSVVTQLEAAELVLDRDPTTALDRLDRARRTARSGLGEARRAVQALRPGPLEHAELPDAIRDVVAAWRREQPPGVDVDVHVEGSPAIGSRSVDEVLLRVVQEALANVGRHAAAHRVTVSLSYLDDLVLLDVHDDGSGFEPDAGAPRADVTAGGFGIESMRARVAGVGGELVVESDPGHGTTVAARVPLGGAGHAPQPDGAADEFDAVVPA